jgi:biopolymer transport protein ExbD
MRHIRKIIAGAIGVQLSLIITPMLDMSFQILSFFIMVYHPSALEGHIPGNLAPPEKMATTGKENIVDPDVQSLTDDELMPELNEAVTVYIKAKVADQEPTWRLEGMATHYFIKTNLDINPELAVDLSDASLPQLERAARLAFKVPDNKEPTAFMINKIWDDKMTAKLEAKLKELGGKSSKANLKLAGDGTLRQQYIMAAFDAGKKAGFSKIHFVPPPTLNTKIKT